MRISRKIKRKYWPLFVIGFIFFISRLINLNLLPVFADEAIYIHWSQIMWHDANQRFIPLSDGKPPLFMWLTIPFLKIISDPLIAGRLLSLVAGFFTLWGSYLLSKALFRQKTRPWVGLLILTSPFLLFYDRLALVDSLLTALGVWSFYFGWCLFSNPRIDLGIFLGLTWGAGMLTKPTGVYFPLLTPLFILAYPAKKWWSKIKKLIAPSFLASAFGLGLYNVLRLSPAMHMISGRSADYLRSKEEILANPFQFIPGTSKVMVGWLVSWLTWPMFIFFLISLVIAFKRKEIKTGILFIWCLVPFMVQAAVGKIIYPRYFLFIAPFILTIAGQGLDYLSKNKRVKLILPLIAFLLLLKPILFDYFLLTAPGKAPLHRAEREQYLEEWSAGYGIKEASEWLKEQAEQGRIAIGTEGYFGTLPDGLQIYLEGVKNIEVFGLKQPISEIEPKLEQASLEKPTYLLVNSTRLILKSERLELLAEYPKPAGPKGQESLLLFKVNAEK